MGVFFVSEVTRERVGQLVYALMTILAKEPEGLRAKDALEQLKIAVPPTEFELDAYRDGLPRFGKIVRFATIDLVKAGWMIKQRGYWLTTPEGIQALKEHPQPTEFYRTATRLYREWSRAQEVDTEVPPIEEIETQDLGAVVETAEGDAWDQVSAHLAAMDPYDFQDLVAALLEGMGYHVSWTAPAGRDGGLDIVAYTDPLGATGPRIKVQVKRWESRVNVEGLRGFLSLLGTNDVGLFVCTGGFTKDAEDHARQQETRRVTLLDADRFFRLWVEHYDHVPEVKRSLLPLRPVYFLDHNALG